MGPSAGLVTVLLGIKYVMAYILYICIWHLHANIEYDFASQFVIPANVQTHWAK